MGYPQGYIGLTLKVVIVDGYFFWASLILMPDTQINLFLLESFVPIMANKYSPIVANLIFMIGHKGQN